MSLAKIQIKKQLKIIPKSKHILKHGKRLKPGLRKKTYTFAKALNFGTPVFKLLYKKVVSRRPISQKWLQKLFVQKRKQKKTVRERRILIKKKKIRLLRSTVKSNLSYQFFQPWKKLKLPLTKKQQWLLINYNKYQKLRDNDRIDFFRTHIGQVLLSTQLHSQHVSKKSWFSESQTDYDIRNRFSKEQMRLEIAMLQKKSWWYDNLVQKRSRFTSAKKFRLERPNTAFQLYWKQQKREPWKDSLLFKRALYEGFGERLRKENKFQLLKIKPYLRRKNPRREKKNQLYHRCNLLLTSIRKGFRIRAKKAARIKQITGKILLPFYGNLRKKQMAVILKKSRTRKSNYLTHNEMLLTHFENRLDVVVYRLNLAPSILWARRLILNGSVFITSTQNANFWDSMYSSMKKFAFPLKLRDPYHLYDKTLWTNSFNQWSKFKFFGQPKRKISYLVQPGDIIQCATGILSNQFKTKSWLWQKPIPTHFMTNKKKKIYWNWRFQKYTHKTWNTWEQNSEITTSAIMLHMPQFNDLDSKDRVQESFFRWATL